MKKKLLVFHQSLAPYRVDLWNTLNEKFDFEIHFVDKNVLEQKFDQNNLKKLLNFVPKYLEKGIRINGRAIRIGYLKIIDRFKPEIVFTYEYSITTLYVYLLKNLFGYNFKLYTICDDSLDIAQNCKGIRKISRNYLAQRLDGIIVVNPKVANWYNTRFNQSKSIVLPIIYQEAPFREKLNQAIPISNEFVKKFNLEGKKCVFFIGRLVKVKNLDFLINAFNEINTDIPEAVLVFVGEGIEYSNLKHLAINYNIENKVIFAGRFECLSLKAWYNIGQVFVLPSIYEPFGAVINEALLAGTTVLCSKLAGASSMITEGHNGNLFDPYNVKYLSNLLKQKLQESPLISNINEVKSSKMNLTYADALAGLTNKLS